MNRARLITLMLVLIIVAWPVQAFAQGSGEVINIEDQNLIATVSTEWAELRSGPGAEYALAGSVPQGTRLPILSQASGWYLIAQPTGQQAWIPSWVVSTAQFVAPASLAPANSALYIAVDTRPGMFDRLDDMLTVMGSSMPGGLMDNFNQLLWVLFMNQGITLNDVRPWLGNEVGVVNLECLSSTMFETLTDDAMQDIPRPRVVILASTIDPAAAQGFINRVLTSGALGQAPRHTIVYNDYTYTLLNDPTLPNANPDLPVVAMGMVGDYVVFAQGAASYQAIIDVARGTSASLAEDSGFQAVYGGLAPDGFLRTYVGPALFCPVHDPILYQALLSETFASDSSEVTELLPTDDPDEIQQQIIAMLDKGFNGYGVGFRNDEGTLVVDLASGVDLEALQEITGLSERELQQRVSVSGMELFGFLTPQTLDVLTFGNLQDNYDALSFLSATTPEALFQTETGLSGDLLAWMDGSVTMGFMDYPVFDPTGEVPAYFLMVVEAASPASAEAALTALVDAASQSATATASSAEIDGIEVTTIEAGEGAEARTLQVALIDNYVVLVRDGSMAQVLENARRTTNGDFAPDWRLLAGLPVASAKLGQTTSETPFVAAFDLGRLIQANQQARIQAAAIVTPVRNGNAPSRITIICSICRSGDTCWPDN